MNKIVLKQQITNVVSFTIDDFETVDEWLQFRDRVIYESSFKDETFLDNVERESFIEESNIWVDISEEYTL
jgi:hypothetical protein